MSEEIAFWCLALGVFVCSVRACVLCLCACVCVKEARFGILPVPTKFTKQPKIEETQRPTARSERVSLSNAKFLSHILFHFSCVCRMEHCTSASKSFLRTRSTSVRCAIRRRLSVGARGTCTHNVDRGVRPTTHEQAKMEKLTQFLAKCADCILHLLHRRVHMAHFKGGD